MALLPRRVQRCTPQLTACFAGLACETTLLGLVSWSMRLACILATFASDAARLIMSDICSAVTLLSVQGKTEPAAAGKAEQPPSAAAGKRPKTSALRFCLPLHRAWQETVTMELAINPELATAALCSCGL